MEVLYIGIEMPSISPPTIIMTMVFLIMEVLKCLRMKEETDLGINRSATLPLAIVEFILILIGVVTMEEVDISLKRPATLPLAIVEQVLMVMGDVDIGIRPATLPKITYVVMREEVDLGLKRQFTLTLLIM